MDMTLDRVCVAHGHLDCLDKVKFFRREHWSFDEEQRENIAKGGKLLDE